MVQTFTITFGDQAENHVGMEKLGHLLDHGFSLDDLKTIQQKFTECETELHCLNNLFDDEQKRANTDKAYVLVVRNGLRVLLDEEVDGKEMTVDSFFEEQNALEKDTKAFMYGRVVNKHARHNLCFADIGHQADYEHGQGTVIPFSQVPCLSKVRDKIEEFTGLRLVAEGNYYFDVLRCGIGYHGDAERRVVVGIRVGHKMPLHYRWYRNSEVVSHTLKIVLKHGDVYVMSEKATGHDWKSRSLFTLRHAAGSSKFLDEEHDI